MSKHSPTPFKVDRHDDNHDLVVRDAEGRIIANFEADNCGETTEVEVKANADLFAAAPDMAAERDRLKVLATDLLLLAHQYRHDMEDNGDSSLWGPIGTLLNKCEKQAEKLHITAPEEVGTPARAAQVKP
jgi:hypothetical protein